MPGITVLTFKLTVNPDDTIKIEPDLKSDGRDGMLSMEAIASQLITDLRPLEGTQLSEDYLQRASKSNGQTFTWTVSKVGDSKTIKSELDARKVFVVSPVVTTGSVNEEMLVLVKMNVVEYIQEKLDYAIQMMETLNQMGLTF